MSAMVLLDAQVCQHRVCLPFVASRSFANLRVVISSPGYANYVSLKRIAVTPTNENAPYDNRVRSRPALLALELISMHGWMQFQSHLRT